MLAVQYRLGRIAVMSQILRFCFLLGAVYSFIDIPLPRYCDDLNIQSVSKYYDVFAVLSDCMDHLYISKSTGSHMPIIDVIYPYPDFTFNGVIHINSHSLIVGAVSESDDAGNSEHYILEILHNASLAISVYI